VGLLNSWVYSRTWGGGGIFDEEKDMDRIMLLISLYEQEKTEEVVGLLEKETLDSVDKFYGKSEIQAGFEEAFNQGIRTAIKIVKDSIR